MRNDTELLLKEYKAEYKHYKEFIDNNEWFDDVYANVRTGKLESTKLSTEVSIISTIIKSTVKFKDDIGDDIDKKPVKDFIKYTSDIINHHIKRIQNYKKLYPITAESNESDVAFHSDLFALITRTKVDLSKLQIDEEEMSKKSSYLFYGDKKAPLAMRRFLSENIPIVQEKTESLGIDFTAPYINPTTSNELFINMKASDIPKWDVNKHFFEQEKSTIQFWEEELNKIRNGVNIYGYHLSPWLYWHINHYKLSYINEHGVKGVFQPQLRDNEYYFDEMYKKAREHGRVGLLLYGTRRFSKTAVMSSKILHDLYTIHKCQATVQGFSAIPDLKALIDYISDAVENIHPALRIPANSMDLTEGAILGLKQNAQDRYDLARLSIVNLESGTTKKGSQKTAGSTPDSFALDEIAKGACLPPWNAAIPSFAGGPGGKWRCTPLLSATAGNAELSADAEKMLKNPEANKILPMDWDILEQIVDPEYITWTRDQFGMFVPAQMSLEAPPKIIKPFGEFLNITNNPELEKLNIHVTDWKAASEFFQNERKIRESDMNALASYKNSFPLEVEDCYLTTEKNIFPGLEAKARRSYVEKEGLDGQKYRLYMSGGEYVAEMVPDEPVIIDYPYKGGSFDAPVVMIENPLLSEIPPPLGLYVMGLDDVRVGGATDGDSVISATVFKRGFEGGEWANRVVGWYDSRPERKTTYYRQLHIMMKIYNARILYENADNGFIEWVETNYPEDVHRHFSTGVGLASEENLHINKNRKFGWSPTGQNIYLLHQKIVMYTKEDNVTIGDATGLSGVDRINHPMLLEELYKYKKDQNADRIRSFGLALTLARYYDNTYQYMKVRKATNDDSSYHKKVQKTRQSYGGIVYDKRLK